MEKPDKLYKFSLLRMEFFDNRFLRISPRYALNDPYEFLPFNTDTDEIRSHIPPKSVGTYKITDTQLNDSLGAFQGVISFTESVDNFLMWSHYADEHKGIAIEFDPTHEFFNDLRKVEYSDERKKSNKPFPYSLDDYFFNKSNHWRYENEWRIKEALSSCDCLINSVTKNQEWKPQRVDNFPWEEPHLYMLQVPPEAILSITFGCRVDEVQINTVMGELKSVSNFAHVKLYKIKLDIGKYRMNFHEINH